MKKIIPSDAILVPDNAELKFKGMIFDVYQWQQQLFDGSEHTFEMLKRCDTVNAICIVDDKILVIDDEQPHLGSKKSFPGGRVDSEDTGLESAAQREVQEETGYSFKNWRLVRVSQPYRKMEWFVYTFVAWEVAGKQDAHLDPGEKITLQELPFGDVKQQVLQDRDYLGESSDIFGGLSSAQELLRVPEFQGQSADR
jgi:ADP-ribose pyrophosphatase